MPGCFGDTMILDFVFRITRGHVLQFAQFSGDRNALHLDAEFARRFRYREPLVHGMLVYSQLSCLQGAFPKQNLTFRKLTGQFLRPVFVDDEVHCSINYNQVAAGSYEFTAKWLRASNQEEVMTAQGGFAIGEKDDSPPSALAECSFVPESLKENELLIDQLQDREESFQFRLTRTLAVSYQKMLASMLLNPASVPLAASVCPNLLATVLLSSLIGMKLPGRYATFLNFDVGFEGDVHWDEACLLSGRVEKVSAASAKLTIRVQISQDGAGRAKGKCAALVNRPPLKMISCAEIAGAHLDLGIKGKVVLVTGASRGIGEVTAKLFALLGAKVAVNFFRGRTDAHEIVREIKQAGGDAFAVECDVRNEGQVRKMIQSVLEHFGDLDVLVNNAVKDVEARELPDLDWSDFLQELEVSLKGLHNCCRAATPIFQRKQCGKIVNLSTTITDSPIGGQAKYIAIKSAVVGYTRSLAKELAKENIQANVVSPSLTETDLMLAKFSPALADKLTRERPAGRNVRPVEVAQSIVFLASRWSDAINGQRLILNLGEDPFL
jgi:3-oxoacyl-[acyl-carrier protein] reductase